MRVAVTDYKVLGSSLPLDASPNGLNDDTQPNGPKTVTQHPCRFWMLTCFDDSC